MFPLKFTGIFKSCSYKGVPAKTLRQRKTQCLCGFLRSVLLYEVAAEQKARLTYDNILRFTDDADVRDPIRFLRAREITHFQRFGDALRVVQDNLDAKNFYAYNPAFDKG